jgi:hypothetical protein
MHHEFYGAPSSGKTVLCHTMCALVSQDKSVGDLSSKSIYVDTEGTFRTEKIAVIAKSRGFDPMMTVDNVMIEEAADSDQQEQVIGKPLLPLCHWYVRTGESKADIAYVLVYRRRYPQIFPFLRFQSSVNLILFVR